MTEFMITTAIGLALGGLMTWAILKMLASSSNRESPTLDVCRPNQVEKRNGSDSDRFVRGWLQHRLH